MGMFVGSNGGNDGFTVHSLETEQPIPVATTDAPELRTWSGDVKIYEAAIAKRDDLIRRMAEMLGYQGISWGRKVEFERLITEANELLGVK